jgi:hypothetical protein
MIFTTHPKTQKKISNVCLELNKRLPLVHELLNEFKFNFPGSNCDGIELSNTLATLAKEGFKQPVKGAWGFFGDGLYEPEGHILINTFQIHEKSEAQIARTIGTLLICAIDEETAFYFDKEIRVFDRKIPSAYSVMGDIFLRIYTQTSRKGVYDYGTEFRPPKENSYHVID